MQGRIIYALIFLVACNSEIDPAYIAKVNTWRTERTDELLTKGGFLSLAGLFWLEEGVNTYGSGEENQLIFPDKAPLNLGMILYENDSIYSVSTEGDTLHMNPPEMVPPVIRAGTLSWHIIKRGERFAIRLKDTESEARKNFHPLEYFPIDPKWNITATFIPFEEPTKIPIENKAGFTSLTPSPGQLHFEIDGNNFSLDVMEEEKDLFIIFGDLTNGSETYGAGRYVHTPKPDEHGKVLLDFNQSYNPPCVFTEFATCPLPPKQNIMNIKVLSGELSYH